MSANLDVGIRIIGKQNSHNIIVMAVLQHVPATGTKSNRSY